MDVDTARDDHVPGPLDDKEVAVLVKVADVAAVLGRGVTRVAGRFREIANMGEYYDRYGGGPAW
jgi:hypothetical protein